MPSTFSKMKGEKWICVVSIEINPQQYNKYNYYFQQQQMAIMESLFDMEVINFTVSRNNHYYHSRYNNDLGSIEFIESEMFVDVVKLWNVIYERIQQFTLGLCSNFETNKNCREHMDNLHVVTSRQTTSVIFLLSPCKFISR